MYKQKKTLIKENLRQYHGFLLIVPKSKIVFPFAGVVDCSAISFTYMYYGHTYDKYTTAKAKRIIIIKRFLSCIIVHLYFVINC